MASIKIIPNKKGFVFARLNKNNTENYKYFGLYYENNDLYGPVVLIEDNRWSSYTDINYNRQLNIVNTILGLNGTFCILSNNTLIDDYIIGEILIDGNNNKYIILNNNLLFTKAIINANIQINITKRRKFNSYSSFYVLMSYWNTPNLTPLSSYYPTLASNLPNFITALHTLGGRKFVGYPANLQDMQYNIEFLLEYQIIDMQNNNLIPYEIKLFLNYDGTYFDILSNNDIHDNYENENLYQYSTGLFSDEFIPHTGPNVLFSYDDTAFNFVRYLPIDIGLNFILLNNHTKDIETLNHHNLILINAKQTIDIKNQQNNIISKNYTPSIFTYSDNNLNKQSDALEIVNNTNIDLHLINKNENLIISFKKINRITALSMLLNKGNKINIAQLTIYNKIFRNSNYLPVYVKPDLNLIDISDKFASGNDIIFLANDYEAKIMGIIGIDINNNVFPIIYRLDYNNIGEKIIIYSEWYEQLEFIYAFLIVDKNSYKAQKLFDYNNDYKFQIVKILPHKTLCVLTNDLEIADEIRNDFTGKKIANFTIYKNLAKEKDKIFELFLFDAIRVNKKIEKYNIDDEQYNISVLYLPI